MFERYLALWRLTPDGEPVATRSSRLLPVRQGGRPAMLKIAIEDEEKAGGALMAWWDGQGAACVLAHDGEAVLLERAGGGRALAAMAREGQDEQATRIICDVVAALHAPRLAAPPSRLIPLPTWFAALGSVAGTHGGLFEIAWRAARDLLEGSGTIGVVLHGDVHHDNVLDFGPAGWLAIDPKGLWGERGYDYANLFRNPGGDVALRPGRFERHVELVSQRADLDPRRLLQWILAVMGLSAAWHVGDADQPGTTLAVAWMAATALGRG